MLAPAVVVRPLPDQRRGDRLLAGHALAVPRTLAVAIAALLSVVCAAILLTLAASGPATVPSAAPALAPPARAASQALAWLSLPSGAPAAVSRGLGADQPAFFAHRAPAGAVALNDPAQGLHATLHAGTIALTAGNGLRVGLSAPAIGRARALEPLLRLSAGVLHANRVTYSTRALGSPLAEWYANGPLGVEQGFTIARRPAGRGPLQISQTISADARARLAPGGESLSFSSSAGSLSYGRLSVTDAAGAHVGARMSLSGKRLLITIEDAHARYPLSVDPQFQQTAELSASDGAESDYLGISVGVSGNTVVAGAEGHEVNGHSDQGAVYVFSKPASGWANATQTAELTASDGAGGDDLGRTVAISGSEIVAAAPLKQVGANARQGALYVYTEPAGGWANATQSAKLTASDGAAADYLGTSLAISSGTIVAGADADEVAGHIDQGAVYVYTEPAGGWANATQTAKLTSSDGAANDLLGTAVGVSGSTIVAGAAHHEVGSAAEQGAAYVYTEPTGGWVNATQTAELTASDGLAGDELADSVSISGSTIVAGAARHEVGSHPMQGAAYVFAEPSGGWVNATQTAELTASDGAEGDYLGSSVAISGATILAGAPYRDVESQRYEGVLYEFSEPAGGWENGTQAAELSGADSAGDDYLGFASAISGSTIVGGALYHETHGHFGEGEAYVFQPPGESSPVTQAPAPSPAPSPASSSQPSNAFTIGTMHASTNGTTVLDVKVPGAGSVEVLGTHESVAAAQSARASSLLQPGPSRITWGRASARSARAGILRLVLHPGSAGRSLLARHRRYRWALNVRFWVTYTPSGGRPRSVSSTVRVLAARRR